MKKYIFIAAAFAALLSCSKSEQPNNETSGTGFEKGQQVTLTVKAGEPSTRVSSALNADGETIDFKWEAGDKILVTVDTKTAEFTLSSGAGTNSATFTGTMPAAGETFDVQYPVTAPVLTTQTYSGTEALPHDKMLFTDEDCQLSDLNFELTAQYAALRLNLYGSKAVGSIVVTTNQDPAKTYTLDCMGTGSSGTEPGKTNEPKPFYIVVPAGTYGFTVIVKDTESGEISSKSTTSDQTFEANKFLTMPPLGYPGTDEAAVTIGGVTWAPVNCGYEPATTGYAGYPYGKLYQWGRKYGLGYTGDATTPAITTYWTGTNGNEDSNTFYKYCNSGATYSYDWIQSGDNAYWNSATGDNGPDKTTTVVPIKTTHDPCPTGWRVPTYAELNALTGNNGSTSIGGNGWDSTNTGYWFKGTTSPESGNGLFLPAAGIRDCSNGNADLRGSSGLYWSSSVNGYYGRSLYFNSGNAGMYDNIYRANGYSVRCVQE